MVYFFLHFIKELEPPAQELVIRGGEKDPLEDMLTTVSVHQYNTAMNNPNNPLFPTPSNFCLNDDQEIMLGLSSGKRDEIYYICLLPISLRVYL